MNHPNNQDRKLPPPVLIISTGRSGSKTLALMLSLHQRVISFHEPKPYLSTENFLAWRQRISNERLKDQIKKARDWLIQSANNNNLIYAESSHFLAHLIQPFHELYQPRFIYLYRDGRDFVRSGLVRPWYQQSNWKASLAGQLRRASLQPFGNPIEDHQLIPPSDARTRFQKIAWLWNEVNHNIQSQLRTLPQENVFRLRLEDLDQIKIQEILQFLRLDTSIQTLESMYQLVERRPNRTQRPYSLPPKDEWATEQVNNFMHFAKEQMEELGYLADNQ